MKKYFFAALGITFGLVLGLSVIGGGIYWWIEVRTPAPPKISVELDGFPDAKKNEDGNLQALVRIVVTNNDTVKLSINDAYLYLTRISDGARTNIRFEVNDIVIYPNEKYVEIVETMPVHDEWLELKDSDNFELKADYISHKEKWIAQLRDTFDFNFSFVSDAHNIRIQLNTQEKISEIVKKDN